LVKICQLVAPPRFRRGVLEHSEAPVADFESISCPFRNHRRTWHRRKRERDHVRRRHFLRRYAVTRFKLVNGTSAGKNRARSIEKKARSSAMTSRCVFTCSDRIIGP